MDIKFQGEASKADFALVIRDYRKSYGERVLFEGASMDILVGERVGIVGPNGSGKTSLIRDIVASAGSLDGGPIRVGPSMVTGYCAQEQELFDPDLDILGSFEALGAREAEIVKLLRGFLFDRQSLAKKIGSLSGGERNRLQIARAVLLGANFLILDEPTNHLDIAGREAVEEGLEDFGGTILAVSHDRWFLEKTVDRLVLIEEGRLVPYEGGFAEYWRDLGGPRAALARRGGKRARGEPAIEGRGAAIARAGKIDARDARNQGRAKELEARLEAAERERAALEREAEGALSKRDFRRSSGLSAEIAELSRRIDRLYEEWAGLG